MSCKLYIGGLSWNTSDESLRSKFEEFGAVEDAVVIKDRESGRSRGFGFVTFQNTDEAESAIEAMNEKDFEGRTIRVDKAGDRPPSSAGGFRGGRGGRGGFGGRPYGVDRERSYGGPAEGGYRRREDRNGERSEYRRREY